MKYEIRKNEREISYKNRAQIKQGCTLDQFDQEPEIIKSFDDKDEALNELKSYKSDIRKLSGGDVLEFSVIPENED